MKMECQVLLHLCVESGTDAMLTDQKSDLRKHGALSRPYTASSVRSRAGARATEQGLRDVETGWNLKLRG